MEMHKKRIGGREVLLREPRSLTSAALHLAGAALSAAGLAVLLVSAVRRGDPVRTVSLLLFGVSLIALYSASTIYHTFFVSQAVSDALRKLDHIMIFFLIAGTYTPLCLVTLRGRVGWVLFGLVWGIAILGTVMKLCWIGAPRWLSALIYLLLGWMIAFAFVPLSRALPAGGMASLVAGGLFYTVGAVLYAKKIELFTSERFGNHELFHIFVLAGSLCHYWMILRYV